MVAEREETEIWLYWKAGKPHKAMLGLYLQGQIEHKWSANHSSQFCSTVLTVELLSNSDNRVGIFTVFNGKSKEVFKGYDIKKRNPIK